MAASEQWGDADKVGTFHFDLLEPKITGTSSVFFLCFFLCFFFFFLNFIYIYSVIVGSLVFTLRKRDL